MISVPGDIQKMCVYCLDNDAMPDAQVLMRGKSSYICAPRGQLVEGFLVVASYDCVGAMSLLDRSALTEIDQFRSVLLDFYGTVYGVDQPIFYEQGRGGGGARFDDGYRFPYHAHFCGLPTAVDAHSVLATRFVGKPVATLRDVTAVAAGEPYVYVDGVNAVGDTERVAYLPESAADAVELEGLRLKPILADLLGIQERADWRVYPGDAELTRVIDRFSRFSEERGDAGG